MDDHNLKTSIWFLSYNATVKYSRFNQASDTKTVMNETK